MSKTDSTTADAPSGQSKRVWVGFGVVFLAALTVRLAVLHPILDFYDFIKYPVLASSLLQQGSHEPFNASPLYIYFWCGMHRIFNYTTFGPRVVQLFIGSLSCGLTYLLALRFVPWGWALGTGLAAAFFAPFVAHDGCFLSEFLVLFLNVAAFVALYRAWDKVHLGWWVCSGILLGLSAIAKPNIVLLFPFLILWGAWVPRAERRRQVAGACLACVLAGCFVLGIMWRNWRVGGEAIPVMSDGGIVFYIANNVLDRGLSYYWPRNEQLFPLGQLDPTHRIAREIACKLTGRQLSIGESGDFWFAKGLEFARQHPGQYAWLSLRKVFYFWNDYEVPDTMAQHVRLTGLKGWWWLHFGLIAPLALLGLITAARNVRTYLPLYLYVGLYVLTAILFGVESRYRLPVVPVLMVFAADAGVWAVRTVRSKRWGPIVAAVIVVGLAGWMCNVRDYEIRKSATRMDINLQQFDHAQALISRHKYQEALPILDEIISQKRLYEAVVDAWSLRYQALREMGDRAGAEKAFAQSLGPLATDLVPPWSAASRADLEQQVAQDPDNIFAQRELGYVAWKEGDLVTAERAFRRVVYRAPPHVSGHYNLAVVLAAEGRMEEARHSLQIALDLMPQMVPAQVLRDQIGPGVP
jgi:4-amino-4-deoxy-L-arabinose transferase-like glycosyltransferase